MEKSVKSYTLLSILPKLSKYNIILGSSSPRRKELIQSIGIINFTCIKSDFKEDLDYKLYKSPQEYCLTTARYKSYDILNKIDKNSNKKNILICADTIVEIDNKVLEKPIDSHDSYNMLSLLNNNVHLVHTAVIIYSDINNNEQSLSEAISFVQTTQVKFRQLSHEDITSYIDIEKPFDKSGSYGIQGLGGSLVESINGCYYNVMGLPISQLSYELCQLINSDVN